MNILSDAFLDSVKVMTNYVEEGRVPSKEEVKIVVDQLEWLISHFENTQSSGHIFNEKLRDLAGSCETLRAELEQVKKERDGLLHVDNEQYTQLVENLQEWHKAAITNLCDEDKLTCDVLCGCTGPCIVMQAVIAIQTLQAGCDWRDRKIMNLLGCRINLTKELEEVKADNAMLLAGAEQNRLALEAAEKETKLLEGFIQDAKAEIRTLTEEKAEEVAKAQHEAAEAAKRAELAEAELAAYKALPWYKKIFG